MSHFSDGDPLRMLRALAQEDIAPAGAEERVHARLAAILVAGSGSAQTSAPATPPPTFRAFWRNLSARWWMGRAIPAIALGALGGAAGYAALAPSKQVVVFVEAPGPISIDAPVAEIAAAPEGLLLSPQPETPTGNAAASISGKVSGPPRTGMSILSQERAILDRARAKMSRGEPNEALSLLGEHEREHARGNLIEEREAMAINALVQLGRYREAEQRGAAFLARFPASLVLPSVQAALANVPGERANEPGKGDGGAPAP